MVTLEPKLIEELADVSQRYYMGLLDKSGLPYWRHPFRVMMRLPKGISQDALYAAVLHDVLEDTPFTAVDLLKYFTPKTVVLVKLLTRVKPETHRQYVDQIVGSGSVEAMLIKLADTYDNADPKRTMPDPVEKEGLMKRYKGTALRLETELMGSKYKGWSLLELPFKGSFEDPWYG